MATRLFGLNRVLMGHQRDVQLWITNSHLIYELPIELPEEEHHYSYIVRREKHRILLAAALTSGLNIKPLLQSNVILHRSSPPVLPGTQERHSSQGTYQPAMEKLL
jgi:hypothetical protein